MSSIKRTGAKKPTVAASSNSKVENHRAVAGQGIEDDRLEVSPEARQIDELFHQLANVDDINAARIKSIRESIKKGNFPIDYQQLADKILELSDELNRDEE